MPTNDDFLDISLLHADTGEFILRCQRIISIIVKHQIKKGMFLPDHYSDVVQSVNEELIKRLPGIQNNFDNSVMLVTYMNVVIRNICIRLFEQERATVATIPLHDAAHLMVDGNFTSILIREEANRLGILFRMYGTQQHKLVVCLKTYFRIPVTKQDLDRCFSRSTRKERATLLKECLRYYDKTPEIENFGRLVQQMINQEQKTFSADSLRRWTNEHIHRIITLLNGRPPQKAHTIETVKTLFEQYINEQ